MISFIDSTGHERFLGNLPAPVRYAWTVYGDTPDTPMIPRSKWRDLIGDDTGPDDPHCSPPHDQDGIGMCNASATAAAAEDCRLQQGLPPVRLSGGDLYRRICGGSDRGSLLEDGIREAMARGIAEVDVVPYLDWRSARPGWAESARRHRVLEAFLCPTFDHCMSAVLKGFRLISGIMWYSNYNPDREGWLPLRGSGGAGGHAVKGYKATWRDGVFGIWHDNSWTAQWGLHGKCVFPEPAYSGPVGGWWCVRSMTTEGGDTPAPVN